MPVSYSVSTPLRTVFSMAHGVLTGEDLLAHKRRLASDPDTEPDFRQLWDFRRVSELAMSREELVELLAAKSAFGPAAMRAFVAAIDVDAEMLRMFQIFREEGSGEIRVFRDIKEARTWVGLLEG